MKSEGRFVFFRARFKGSQGLCSLASVGFTSNTIIVK